MNLFPTTWTPAQRDIVQLLIVIAFILWPAIITWIIVQVIKRARKRKQPSDSS